MRPIMPAVPPTPASHAPHPRSARLLQLLHALHQRPVPGARPLLAVARPARRLPLLLLLQQRGDDGVHAGPHLDVLALRLLGQQRALPAAPLSQGRVQDLLLGLRLGGRRPGGWDRQVDAAPAAGSSWHELQQEPHGQSPSCAATRPSLHSNLGMQVEVHGQRAGSDREHEALGRASPRPALRLLPLLGSLQPCPRG